MPTEAVRLRGAVSRNVVNLGLTSLFTDISSEMVSTVLPIYLVFILKFTPLQFGALDGLYQGGAALIRLVGGVAADRSQRYKEVAALGYGLSALSKIGLLFGGLGGPGILAASLFVDRTGKGIRTAPRDALISLSSTPQSLGISFAVHRALDTCGAMIGPLLAFGVLTLIPNGFDVIFVLSLCVALVGLGVLVLFVQNRAPTVRATEAPRVNIGEVLLRAPRFKYLVLAAGGLGLATISDGFLYLTLQHRLTFAASFIPLLYVATSLVYFLLALPAGRLADRLGRGRVFIAGYGLLLAVYAVLLLPFGLGETALVACILLFGGYYALTDGVLMAFASSMLPAEVRTTGLAVLTAAAGLGSLAASLVFGALWTFGGPESAVSVFVGGLSVAIALTFLALWRTRAQTTPTSSPTPTTA
ncbi:MAG TPA: MFS transporter [Chloroflexota bacterium]|nr:MFS transporter [Chloroflexota bacterium]